MKYDFTLCQNNNFVQGNLKDLKKTLKKLGIVDESVYNLINVSLADLRIMKKQGQSFENRCRLYRRSIEKLGFERTKKETKWKKKQ